MGCKLKRCNICWLRRQLIGVAVIALGVYWGSNDSVTQQVCTTFAFSAVIVLLVMQHED